MLPPMAAEIAQRPAARGSLCPSCERFIGPADLCPYCGAESARNPLFRLLRLAALALAVLGLAFLYLMSVHKDTPRIAIGDISPFMNFASVRVKGAVERTPYTSRRDGKVDYIFFTLDDGSGQLRVAAERRVARELADRGLIPAAGERVEVSGSLGVSADGAPRLRLRRIEDLKIASPAAGRNSAL
jgi:hypothetical protein